jgi:hypothetical protein
MDTEDCPLPRTANQILTYKSRVEPREKSQGNAPPRWTERPFVHLTGTSISVGYAVTVHCEVFDGRLSKHIVIVMPVVTLNVRNARPNKL